MRRTIAIALFVAVLVGCGGKTDSRVAVCQDLMNQLRAISAQIHALPGWDDAQNALRNQYSAVARRVNALHCEEDTGGLL